MYIITPCVAKVFEGKLQGLGYSLVKPLPNVQEALGPILALNQLGMVAHANHPSI